jgi:hypothetical protein
MIEILTHNGVGYSAMTVSQLLAAGVPKAAIDAHFVGQRASAIKAECGRRIFAVASQNAQMNMTAACVAGAMTDSDKATFAASLLWVGQMRTACGALIASADADYAVEAKWPVCPAAVLALVARF